MKNVTRFLLIMSIVMALCNDSLAQTSLGTSKGFMDKLKKDATLNPSARSGEKILLLEVSRSKILHAKINYQDSGDAREFLIGEIEDVAGSSFYIKVTDKSLEGHIILKATKEAYKYHADADGNAYISKVDINTLICLDYLKPTSTSQKSADQAKTQTTLAIAPALLNLQSLPGAAGCVLLDFDGHFMPAGNLWNNGNAINAAPSGMSDADVQQHWEVVAEDYRPFNLNITTNEGVFNSYPRNRRMRVVITPTNTAAPGAGGVAYIGSFNWDNDVPCWVFITSGKAGGDASAHEIGHTFDLGHDGRTNPAEEYFVGIDGTSWAPIMGAGYYRPVVQWSKGEYNFANNFQDDVATIAGAKFGVGYRGDDYGDNTSSSATLDYNSNGAINQKNGVISSEADYDFFSFTTGGGNVSIDATTVGRDGNLHLLIRLYNAAGAELGTYWNSDPFALNASMNVNLAAGKYFIGVDGNGAGDRGYGGYSSYGSIGSYSVTGTIPPGGNVNPSTNVVTVYKDCNYTGFSGGLEIGDYNLARLRSLGVLDDDISSVRITQGFKVILYQDDNLTGGSTVLTSDLSCFDGTWNDKVTSIRVVANGDTNLGNVVYHLQNRNSGLYMDVWGIDTADGASIAQGTYNGGANQQFRFVHLGDGTYQVQPAHSGKAIDVAGISRDNGASIVQWTYFGTPNQQFIAVPTGDGFYKLVARHSGRIVEVINASTDNGANVQQWDNNNQTCGQWKLVPVPGAQVSTLIQAENYSNMSGIQTEPTTDADGGLNVGYANTGDWMAYAGINFPTTGAYLIEYRVASAVGGARISADLNAGTIPLGALDVPNTGAWQNWQTISHTVTVNAGTYDFGVFIQNTGVNINWIRITNVGAAAIAATANVQNEDSALSVKVYPNPVENTLFFSTNMAGTNVQVLSPTGNPVSEQRMSDDNSLDVSSLKSGIYLIVFEKDARKTTKRFVKK
ncbi:carbohydrate-binding protein [Parachryseolinea silvisoli]|uniref:carbohydrate-binding protein n=1 Tax=Parachryseolinea silvisoli TaxID=2873601 RepID=UPI002265F455|nr:carbohydrate-binding protein [Parachryseolinea silvisoli]MCD9018829.1 carbohydrate-binding protein [Parachryseolinea silvisoli]